jgi:hypothetical protein
VVALETKRNAVGRATAEQERRWLLYLTRAEDRGRARVIPGTASLIGCDWEIDVAGEEHGRWLIGWLQDAAGFGPTMLRLSRKPA